jgi:hypothetical protein
MSDRLLREEIVATRDVAITRLNAQPRGGDGRHRRLVGYCDATMTTAELVRLLRETAERLAKSLPKVAP